MSSVQYAGPQIYNIKPEHHRKHLPLRSGLAPLAGMYIVFIRVISKRLTFVSQTPHVQPSAWGIPACMQYGW